MIAFSPSHTSGSHRKMKDAVNQQCTCTCIMYMYMYYVHCCIFLQKVKRTKELQVTL